MMIDTKGCLIVLGVLATAAALLGCVIYTLIGIF